MQINRYYDWTWTPGIGGDYTTDTEGNLVQLCRDCAAKAGRSVSWAGQGDDESCCEQCEATEQAAVYAFYAREDTALAATPVEDCQAYDRRMANEASAPAPAQRYVVYHRAPNTPITTPWTLQLRGATFPTFTQASRTLRKLGKVEGSGCHYCVFPLAPGVTAPATLGAEEGLGILYRS